MLSGVVLGIVGEGGGGTCPEPSLVGEWYPSSAKSGGGRYLSKSGGDTCPVPSLGVIDFN